MTKKFTLVYENINKEDMSGWETNGRIEPTTIPPPTESRSSWIKRVYNILFVPNGSPDKLPYILAPYFGIQQNYQYYDIKEHHELMEDEKYIYVINVFSMHLFVDYNSHIAISEKILNDARRGKCFILFVYPNEGHLLYFIHKFSKLVEALNVPKSNLVLLHADFNKEKFNNFPFTYIPICIFPWWIRGQRKNTLIEYSPEKLFVCHNREVRIDRMTLLLQLKKSNLLDLGHYSCGFLYDMGLFSDEDKKFLKSIEGTSPDNLKISGDDRINPASIVDESSAEKSFCTIVPETEAKEDSIVYFTEKTFKPILLGHPFMLLGGRNQLKKLKDFGYKTFDKWWDESYDEEIGFENRINKIVKNISILSRLNINQLVTIRNEMRDTLAHNQQLYLNTVVKIEQEDHISQVLLNTLFK